MCITSALRLLEEFRQSESFLKRLTFLEVALFLLWIRITVQFGAWRCMRNTGQALSHLEPASVLLFVKCAANSPNSSAICETYICIQNLHPKP